MTRQQLAEKLCQSTQWVDERLSLNNLDPGIATLVDNGQINLTNAYALSKLPVEEQSKHVDAAISEQHKTFVPRMKERVKEIRESKKSGKDPNAPTFTPVQYMQKISDVKKEVETGLVKAALLKKAGVNSEDGQKGFDVALQWILHFDDESIKAQVAKHEERESKRKVEAEKRKAERDEKKKNDAAEKAASVDSGW